MRYAATDRGKFPIVKTGFLPAISCINSLSSIDIKIINFLSKTALNLIQCKRRCQYLVAPSAFDYPELAPWPVMLARIARRIFETGAHQFADRPDVIRNPKRHYWSFADGFMHGGNALRPFGAVEKAVRFLFVDIIETGGRGSRWINSLIPLNTGRLYHRRLGLVLFSVMKFDGIRCAR